MLVKLNHVAMSVPNLEESIKWYQDILGFELLSKFMLPGAPFKFAFVGNDNMALELIEVDGAKPLPAGRSHPDEDNATHGVKHICIAVENNREFVKKLKEKGVKVVFEPENVPSYCAFINDPTGNIIEVFDVTNDIRKIGK
jgi:lactoylglutathione lyase